MVSINLPNVITIMLISLVAVALAKWGFRALGMDAGWL